MAIVFSAKITGQINADDIFSKGNYYTGAVCAQPPPPFFPRRALCLIRSRADF
jgi:hypothetical protein